MFEKHGRINRGLPEVVSNHEHGTPRRCVPRGPGRIQYPTKNGQNVTVK